jgi:hypothetical protein
MKLPTFLITRLHALMQRRVAEHRPPDYVIGGEADPYLRRWWVIPRNRFFNIYLHHFVRSDDDRALHDHPWWNCSILLEGAYREHLVQDAPVLRKAGAIAFRRPRVAHRVELLPLHAGVWFAEGKPVPIIEEHPCWTIFITGPRVREWGFLCPRGWRHWKDFTAGKNGEIIGKGCD